MAIRNAKTVKQNSKSLHFALQDQNLLKVHFQFHEIRTSLILFFNDRKWLHIIIGEIKFRISLFLNRLILTEQQQWIKDKTNYFLSKYEIRNLFSDLLFSFDMMLLIDFLLTYGTYYASISPRYWTLFHSSPAQCLIFLGILLCQEFKIWALFKDFRSRKEKMTTTPGHFWQYWKNLIFFWILFFWLKIQG